MHMKVSSGHPTHSPGNWARILSYVAGILLCVLIVAGCAAPPAETPPSPTEVVEAPAPVETLPPEPAVVVEAPAVAEEEVVEEVMVEPDPELEAKLQLAEAAWNEGPHSQTYDLGKGPNTYCSRCHSPQNWDPASTVDLPPNCVTCKFPTDPELRIASTMDFVAEEDWKGIGCETCHPVSDGVPVQELAWLNVITEEHEPVNTSNELCQKCHVTTQGVRVTGGRGVDHGIVLGGSAHLNWAGALPQDQRPSYCSNCHNPHSTQPKQCVDCHDTVLSLDTHIKGMGAIHTNVSCLACHDASGMLVGPHPDPSKGGEWVTLVASVSRAGDMVTAYQKSHSIMWEVECTRCHFEDNPHELIVLNPDGSIPEPPEE
jgi:hypothetical protein